MVEGKYDNYKMCVASFAGKKGGTMANIMFIMKTSIFTLCEYKK